nr:esterase/beta-lactamase LipL-like isoform X1 [Ziziphus jujuba var. spinosa]XP_048331177.1 esterase/beta-lactamase LipL-like isoform X1 [Ziziphus jujuba var. spinosa]XP_048331178.1 esterase/beta-lactamase LipL-like isoform X1 [Ziziphus jujuba var. spinosa]XP_048331179.1 esterase/beta-lactamase LipL-like isoform X1 [Ziziphus jujuba var. spinosa]XP_048331180.1 esterase/beta-lactamase LipL-like isoform X1 [Ziziphus jujuba var. spinosa]
MVDNGWIYDTPVHSDVEAKLRHLLVDLQNDILGIQVCAYKDGEVIIDTAAGVLGENDPRPVQPDTLFPVFSVTKGITAGMLHWLVDNGLLCRKLKFDENVANIWPEFGSNRKDLIKVHHLLNHTSGLHNAMSNLLKESQPLLCDWDGCLNHIAMSVPETEPGELQLYHSLSFGWLCGGIIEHASGKKFQEILEEAFIHPLQVEGELYIGIPPGVESRLAMLALDIDSLNKFFKLGNRPDLPSSLQPVHIPQIATTLAAAFNMLNYRRAIIPAANGHCSARALARYYAALVDGGVVPPPHSSSSKPPLGSHPYMPKFSPQNSLKEQQDPNQNQDVESGNHSDDRFTKLVDHDTDPSSNYGGKIFRNSRIHDAFMGVGEYGNLVKPDGKFGLGFRRFISKEGSLIGFGHPGMGGSTGFCDIQNRFAISVTLSKLSFGDVTASIIHLVCSELNIPVPEEYLGFIKMGADAQLNLERPLIN